jgi:acetylglutamate kinase
MGGKSKSKTVNKTLTETNNANNESGVQITGSDGNSIVVTDRDAIALSFGAIEEISRDALEFANSANERTSSVSFKAIDSVEGLATEIKTGDLKTTKTIYLAGIGIVGAIVLAVVVTANVSGNKQKVKK